MICVRAAQGAGFKRCCLQAGKYDGANRNYFFQGVDAARRLAYLCLTVSPLTFAFYSLHFEGKEMGNGGRLHCLP
jgi:hypothetical protein